MAVAAHPDDIEIMMGGTFLLLGQAGYELHYMNIANGSCGSTVMSAEETIRVRTGESREAASLAGAVYHGPLVDDLKVYYSDELIRRLCALVREIGPAILLLPSPQDYMEDHMNASRLMVTAAFCRNMPNFETFPQIDAVDTGMALYHAMPYGLRDQLRKPVYPDFLVDTGDVLSKKRDMLVCHKSQKEWLDETQGLDNYLNTMVEMTESMGRMSGKFRYAEGWRRHSHLGFADEDYDPLCVSLSSRIVPYKGENNGETTQ
jgi:LmbE family N-acetylglucosaminyl deacetylase